MCFNRHGIDVVYGLSIVGAVVFPSVSFAATEIKNLKNIDDVVADAGTEIGYLGSLFYNTDIYRIIGEAILWINSLAGIVVLLFLIYGGWLWMTAEGNDEKVTQAKAILKTSFIALIIIFGAAAISSVILLNAAGGSWIYW